MLRQPFQLGGTSEGSMNKYVKADSWCVVPISAIKYNQDENSTPALL